ncbi:PKD domain-containing protein [Colwellia psychrerythraea]|uniref:Putative protease n=1 Tax=Colwellia psychrerythraea (strain 34H / ATCC BAA-681) TaxID=167879 RepID=Q484H5_COLP3|nr:M10 family metallopeptidase C-terminal domain-containing protein [Colwellia psychrerythraea]AAZ28155.1 putative protease [Colwellia psychrerythraea 34H]
MLKHFVRSALFIIVVTIPAIASAAEDLDLNKEHVYFQSGFHEKPYLLEQMLYSDGNRWNFNQELGTPVTITYGFTGDEMGYVFPDDIQRDFYQYEKDVIVDVLTHISEVSGITFEEKFTRENSDFVFRIGAYTGSGSNVPPIDEADYIRYSYRRTVTFSQSHALHYLNPNHDFYLRVKNDDIDYKHDFARSKAVILRDISRIIGLTRWNDGQENNNDFYSVMAPKATGLSSETFAPTTLKKYDIVMLQHLYGKPFKVETDPNMTYNYDDSYDFHQMIVDKDGEDTISVVNSQRSNIIDLHPGAFSSIASRPTGFFDPDTESEHLNRSYNNLSIDYGTRIENAEGGSNNDVLIGNYTANKLNGNAGDDKIQGYGGNDLIDGGAGIDTAVYANEKVQYEIEYVGNSVTVLTLPSGNEGLDTLTNIEFIQFSDETIAINQAPVITLGEIITVKETDHVTIIAGVLDHEGDELTYTWTQLNGTDVELTNTDTATIIFTTPNVDREETITLQLEVSDGLNTVTSSIAVVVTPNTAPVITDITVDQAVDERTTVTLAINATDADNDTLIYRWVVNGATVTLIGSTTNTVTFTAPSVTSTTTLTVEVFVTDGIDEVSSDTRTVTVNNVDTAPEPEVSPTIEKSSGGSFGYFILLIAGLRLFRK